MKSGFKRSLFGGDMGESVSTSRPTKKQMQEMLAKIKANLGKKKEHGN